VFLGVLKITHGAQQVHFLTNWH